MSASWLVLDLLAPFGVLLALLVRELYLLRRDR
jgi:hypothetical protein